MSMADVSVVVLVALFAATLLPRFNLGLAALPAAFLVGLAADRTADEVTAFFPADFFVLIVGITALFAVAQLNGTLDWLLDGMLRLVGGRVLLVALVPFLIGAVLTAIGTLPAAATAVVAPVALGLAARYGISPLIAAVLGITGIISGLLSPLAVYGTSARRLGDTLEIGLPDSAPVVFFLGGLVAGLAVAAGCLLVGLRTGAVPRGRVSPTAPGTTPTTFVAGPAQAGPETGSEAEATGRAVSPAAARVLTLTCLAAVVVLSVGFDANIGYLGLTAAVVQQIVLRLEPGEIVSRIPWNIVLLVGGLLTYVGLMQDLGAFARISDLLRVEGAPLLSLLVLCYIAGITSFAASSIAVFATTMPLVPAVVAEGASPVGAVLAVALASILVDINPLGITGGLILGAARPDDRPRLFRHLLTYGAVSVVVGPALACVAFGWW
ncbi:SLC13 family permease [Streptomyces sp. A13(2022)]|uniref:SLC13 family permease n=1 Tax=Streptomyces sp. A13(2022) TaxID=2964768 RepID=UPI0021DA97BF|nr:SLC13 family permease [Streptomyces sp. A13(2022)]MCU8590774.1 SLC13 family permease [Streptomyces sp. A13(2022)]